MNYILALDIGLTTGYAIMDDSGRLEAVGHFLFNDENFVQEVELLKTTYSTPDTTLQVVMEEPATVPGRLGKLLSEVTLVFRTAFPERRLVQPGTWKTSAAGQHSVPRQWQGVPLSSHMKDAIRIAVWYREELARAVTQA